jgi:hypothetical protein
MPPPVSFGVGNGATVFDYLELSAREASLSVSRPHRFPFPSCPQFTHDCSDPAFNLERPERDFPQDPFFNQPTRAKRLEAKTYLADLLDDELRDAGMSAIGRRLIKIRRCKAAAQ